MRNWRMKFRGGTRLAKWLMLFVAFLIVYGSLYPFHFSPVESHGVLDLLGRLGWARTTHSDIAANVLLYLPFGACLGWLLSARLGGPVAVVVATVIGALLSTCIEVAQIFEVRRVASLADIFYNGLGTLLGAALGLALSSARHRFTRHAFSGLLNEPIATALILLWGGFRLSPFALSFRPAEWLAAVKPLSTGNWLAPAETFRYLVPWLVIGEALRAMRGQLNPLPALVVLMMVVQIGLIVASGRSLVPGEFIAMPLALLLVHASGQLAPRRRMALVAALLMVLVVVQGLAPYDFRMDPDAFGLVPFRDALTRYRATNLQDMFEKCFLYGALVWLLVRAGLTVLAATLLSGGLVLSIELLQAWLPNKLAEITDPLLVLVAGGLIAVFDDAPGRAVGMRLRR